MSECWDIENPISIGIATELTKYQVSINKDELMKMLSRNEPMLVKTPPYHLTGIIFKCPRCSKDTHVSGLFGKPRYCCNCGQKFKYEYEWVTGDKEALD